MQWFTLAIRPLSGSSRIISTQSTNLLFDGSDVTYVLTWKVLNKDFPQHTYMRHVTLYCGGLYSPSLRSTYATLHIGIELECISHYSRAREERGFNC